MNRKNKSKLSMFLPAIIGTIIGAILFVLGALDDAPGLCFMGIAIGFLLILWSISNAGLIKKSQLVHIIALCFGLGFLVMSVVLQIDGEFEEMPFAFYIGLSLGLILISFEIIRWIKYKQIYDKKEKAWKINRIILLPIAIIVLLGTIFGIVDYLRAKSDKSPIFAIKMDSYDDGGSRDYFGLGYKVVKCNTLSGDKSAHFGFYNIDVDKVCNHNTIKGDFTIVDETKSCDTALELIWEDDSYKYYFECIKSNTVFIVFADGSRMSIKEAQLLSSFNWIALVVERYPELFYKEKINSKQFRGTIIEVYPDNSFIVEPLENDEIRKSSDKIIVHSNIDRVLEIDTKIIVTFDGTMMDSNPPQVNAIDIKIYSETNEKGLVTMNVKENTIKNTGITLVLSNHSDYEYTYGEAYNIERKENGNWVSVKPIINNYGFNDIGYILSANESDDIKVDWEWLYGKLSKGQYRINKEVIYVKEVGDLEIFPVSAEFYIK